MEHMARRLLAIALVFVLFAGCTNKDGDADPGADNNGTTGGGGGGAGNDLTTPSDFNLSDSGQIAGPFSQSWPIEVENVAFRSATVHFALSGAQAGAPPTARVNLALTDPDGAVVMSATIGLGGSGDSVDWTLTAAELATAGTYTLAAVADDSSPLPSAGLASWEMAVLVTY